MSKQTKAVEEPRPANRHEKRRMRTRASLVEAAQHVMAEKGFEAATIADITESADVALGSFYNHFQSKDEIMQAAALDFLLRLADGVDEIISRYTDPAEEQAAAWIITMELGIKEPNFGWFVVRNAMESELMETSFRERLLRDLKKGVACGRFQIADPEVAASAIMGAQISVITGVLQGKLPFSAVRTTIAMLLGMVGVPLDEAHVIANQSQAKLAERP